MGLTTIHYTLLAIIRDYINDGWRVPFTYRSLEKYIDIKKKARYEPQGIERAIRKLVEHGFLAVDYRRVYDPEAGRYKVIAYFTPTAKFWAFFNQSQKRA